jgi:hypothetical protein
MFPKQVDDLVRQGLDDRSGFREDAFAAAAGHLFPFVIERKVIRCSTIRADHFHLISQSFLSLSFGEIYFFFLG